MLPLLVGVASGCGIAFLFVRYVYPSLFLDLIYLRARKRVAGAVLKAVKEKKFFIDIFEDKVSENTSKTFLIFEDKKYSYEEIDKLANRTARAALEIGLTPGSMVAVLMYNEPALVWTYLGFLKLGLRIVFINYNLRSRSLTHCIQASEADYLIIGKGEALVNAVQEILPDVPNLKVFTQGQTDETPLLNSFSNAMSLVSEEPIEKAVREHMTFLTPAIFIFTSGTTGLPKPAIIDQLRLLVSGHSWDAIGMTADDIVYETLPMYHSAALMVGFANTVTKGATIVLRSKFSASQFWEDCRKHHVTIFQYIGEICRYLVAQPKHNLDRVHKIRIAYGNGLRQDIWAEFQQRFKIPQIVEFYGATESPVMFANVTNKFGACGRSSPLLRKYVPLEFVKFDLETQRPIRDTSGRCVPIRPGEIGLLISPLVPERPRFQGYLGKKDATEKKLLRDVFKKGDLYFNTGDLLKLDTDYYVYFNDRVGDTFRWKGENVSTTEVSNVLTDLDFIHDANVYGVLVPGGDGRAGMASLTLSDGEKDVLSQLQLDAMSNHVNELLPFYARPRFIRVQKEFDMTSTFKQQKMTLVEEGFDIINVTDPIYVYSLATQDYKRLDAITFFQIMAGKVPL